MEEAPSSPTDSTSIKPVSSLRSRFETLANDQPPVSPITPRPPSQLFDLRSEKSNASLNARAYPRTPTARPSSEYLPSTPSLLQTSLQSGNSARPGQDVLSKKPPPAPPVSLRPTPPTVNVESPSSPPKDAQPPVASATPSRAPVTPPTLSTSALSSANHSRTPSRVTTPALEARMSAFLQAAQLPSQPLADTDSKEIASAPKPRPNNSAGGPPPVNRAGKPKLASLPPPSLDSAPADTAGSKSEISPFSTPPSSSESASSKQLHSQAKSSPSPRPISNSRPRPSPFSPTASQSSSIRDHGYEQPPEKPPRPISRSLETQSYHPPHARPQSFHPQSYHPQSFQPISTQDGADEQLPGLPPRPSRQIKSGRTSPVRQQRIPARRSMDIQYRPSSFISDPPPPPRRTSTRSALTQGFGFRSNTTASRPSKPLAPAVPAPRRSADTRREEPPREAAPQPQSRSADDFDDPPIMPQGMPQGSAQPTLNEYPDASQTNRRLPQFSYRPWEIATGYDTKLFAVCGDIVCTTGFITRAWNLRTGETCLTLAHAEGIKITALAFKPTPDPNEEGNRLWLGSSIGEIHEIDIPTQSVVFTKNNAHPRKEIVKLYRHASQLWSLDTDGGLAVWSAGRDGTPNLDTMPQIFRTVKGHNCSIIVNSQLWLASGKSIHVFQPNATTDSAFQVSQRPLQQDSAGEVTSVATISNKPDLIYFGHADGKMSVYNQRDFSCIGLVHVSPYKIISLTGAGHYLWAGYNTGRIQVYDTSTTPWKTLKDWQAHDKPVCNIITDRQSLWKMDRLQVVSLGLDNMLRPWDGLMEEDWQEAQMQAYDDRFCKFDEMTAAVLTWNAGATKPTYLKNDPKDNNFFKDYLCSQEPPDILIFGFQELVDLEDKKVTAKSFFKSKKKDPNEQEHVGHQYRAWRDHISRCIEDFMSADQAYALLHTSSMVGLFSCVFVKTALRSRIKQVNASEIKRGMGGLHGNKGALIIRMVLDDSSICLVNCHLAAGQGQTASRNNDAAAILESICLPEALNGHNSGTFVAGGDGSMILDHELCIWNGDLNYRIDAMPRDTVVRAVKENNLAKLLERDQLLLSRRKNPTFRLQVFKEMPITFAPTYKYNVGTDDYDSSEKKRAPAWCDRILFRGMGRIKGEDYRRWEVRVSDHRPVSARFRMRIKKIDEQKRKQVWQVVEQEFQHYKDRIAAETKLDYLTNVLGLRESEAKGLLE
ncbi:hypothetical protein AAFC00_006309 [Neodothiora populina]|uniref:Inositol polyphosphate-related phosphatase domain-containing protein n=1 Tax=Neodothiora populina TaxID=2781224 RepID=A0ABR3P5J0_9PEZI